MNITLRQILSMDIDSINKLYSAEVSYKTARKIKHNIDVLNKEINTFNSFREKTVEKYGEYEDEEKTKLTEESVKIINEKITSSADAILDIDIEPLMESEIENIKISAQDLMNIDFMIESDD